MAVYQARPTTYGGVQMRSRTEATFAAFLDRQGFVWEYEPCAYASPAGQYLPDFRITVGGFADARLYIDVKGTLGDGDISDAIDAVFERMSVIWASEPGAVLAVAVSDLDDGELVLFTREQWARRDPGWRAYFCVCRHCATTGVGFRGSVSCQRCGAKSQPAALLRPFYRGMVA